MVRNAGAYQVLTARALRSEFETMAVAAGRSVVYDERTALALIDRAEDAFVAVASVEPVWAEDLSEHEPPRAHRLTEVQRLRSWHSAREFVHALAGRGLYFDVVLEAPVATLLAKFRYVFRTGTAWSRHSSARGGTIR